MRTALPIFFLLVLFALPTFANAATPEETPLWEVKVPGEVKDVALNGDGTVVAVLSDRVLSWYTGDGTFIREIPANNAESIGISEDGSVLISGGANLRTYDRNGEQTFRFDTGFFAFGTGVSPEGSCIGGGFDNRSLTFFRADTTGDFKPAWTVNTTEDPVSMAVAENGSHLAACTKDGLFHFYSTDGRLLWSYDTGSEDLACAVTNDGSYVVVGADHGVVLLLNRNGILIWTEVVGERLPSVSISADGSVIAVGGSGDGVVLRSLKGDDLGTLGNGDVHAVAVSADGTRVAAGGPGGRLALFSAGTDEAAAATLVSTPPSVSTPATEGTPTGEEAAPSPTRKAGLSVLPALAAVALLLWGRR